MCEYFKMQTQYIKLNILDPNKFIHLQEWSEI